MGLGRDLAKLLDPDAPHHEVLENFRDQLIIALLKKLADKNGNYDISVADVDATGDTVVSFAVRDSAPHDGKVFHFELRKQ